MHAVSVTASPQLPQLRQAEYPVQESEMDEVKVLVLMLAQAEVANQKISVKALVTTTAAAAVTVASNHRSNHSLIAMQSDPILASSSDRDRIRYLISISATVIVAALAQVHQRHCWHCC